MKTQRGSIFPSQGDHGGFVRKNEVQTKSWKVTTVTQVKKQELGEGHSRQREQHEQKHRCVSQFCVFTEPLGSPSCRSTAIITWGQEREGKGNWWDWKARESPNLWGLSKKLKLVVFPTFIYNKGRINMTLQFHYLCVLSFRYSTFF